MRECCKHRRLAAALRADEKSDAWKKRLIIRVVAESEQQKSELGEVLTENLWSNRADELTQRVHRSFWRKNGMLLCTEQKRRKRLRWHRQKTMTHRMCAVFSENSISFLSSSFSYDDD